MAAAKTRKKTSNARLVVIAAVLVAVGIVIVRRRSSGGGDGGSLLGTSMPLAPDEGAAGAAVAGEDLYAALSPFSQALDRFDQRLASVEGNAFDFSSGYLSGAAEATETAKATIPASVQAAVKEAVAAVKPTESAPAAPAATTTATTAQGPSGQQPPGANGLTERGFWWGGKLITSVEAMRAELRRTGANTNVERFFAMRPAAAAAIGVPSVPNSATHAPTSSGGGTSVRVNPSPSAPAPIVNQRQMEQAADTARLPSLSGGGGGRVFAL